LEGKKVSLKYRTYKRIFFKDPLKSNVSITRVFGNPVKTKSSQVHIHNISQGGLSFSSKLNFSSQDLELMFHVQILGKVMTLKGTIIWQERDPSGIYHYGVALTKLHVQFFQVLDHLSPQRKILA
jgi:hypothetical protein